MDLQSLLSLYTLGLVLCPTTFVTLNGEHVLGFFHVVFHKLAAICGKCEDRMVETAKNVNYAAELGKFIRIIWKQISTVIFTL